MLGFDAGWCRGIFGAQEISAAQRSDATWPVTGSRGLFLLSTWKLQLLLLSWASKVKPANTVASKKPAHTDGPHPRWASKGKPADAVAPPQDGAVTDKPADRSNNKNLRLPAARSAAAGPGQHAAYRTPFLQK